MVRADDDGALWRSPFEVSSFGVPSPSQCGFRSSCGVIGVVSEAFLISSVGISMAESITVNLENKMNETIESKNKALVLEAFDTLFNKRDYVTCERYWSPNYIQHSAHIEPGRDGLFNLIKSAPPTLKYEPGVIVADGDFVIIHGRFSGNGRPKNWIAADILRIVDGILVEHWDVLQDEASHEESKSGLPMFGNKFPEEL
jgi:predicted SnoaL-like aldol condensation-catalyzing enzyme